MMNLIPWRAAKDLSTDAFDRLFDGWFGPSTETGNGSAAWLPALDVIEGEKDYTVRVELPGVDPKDVQITVQDHVLTLSGEKKFSREEKGKAYARSECAYGFFQRALSLPDGVKADQVTAEGAHGVLEIRIPKPEAATARRIPVASR
jgi:HSP20 family protein